MGREASRLHSHAKHGNENMLGFLGLLTLLIAFQMSYGICNPKRIWKLLRSEQNPVYRKTPCLATFFE
ncbi:MAG: hypothetical protein B6245_01940 [Desulfobacteraceae bacterium 4572_88]|nr:MAG: hypothetical protein B6245_01940 [Desulfobacteraceae bacterium 4572_88]